MDKLDLILAELQGIKTNQHRHEEMISQLMQIVGVTNGKVVELQKDVAILKEDVAVLKEDVAVLKEDVAVLKEDVAVLKEDVAVLKEDVAVLKEDVVDLKSIVRRLDQGKQRQDRILEALSVRSLEQETEMKELRRAM